MDKHKADFNPYDPRIQYPMFNDQVGVPLVGTRTTKNDSRKRADTRPAPTYGLCLEPFRYLYLHIRWLGHWSFIIGYWLF